MISYSTLQIAVSIVITSIVRLMMNSSIVAIDRSMGAYTLVLDYCYTWTRVIIAQSVVNFFNIVSPVAFVMIATTVELISSGLQHVISNFSKTRSPISNYIEARTFSLTYILFQYITLLLVKKLSTNWNAVILAWSLIYYISFIYFT